MISEKMFRKLFTHFSIFPQFLDIVFQFGAKIRSTEGSMPALEDEWEQSGRWGIQSF